MALDICCEFLPEPQRHVFYCIESEGVYADVNTSLDGPFDVFPEEDILLIERRQAAHLIINS